MNFVTQALLISGFVIFSYSYLASQDPHFSQSFSSPISLNPSLTGLIDGSYRVGAIYRDQWRTILDNPMTTYSANGDVRFSMGEDRSKFPDFFGVGLQFSSDRIGLFDFNTTGIGIFGAYHKSISERNSQYLSAGFSIHMVQKNINYENLDFQDEFNGVNGYDLPGDEFLPPNNFGYGDFAMGVHYSQAASDNWNLFAGVSLHHLATPNVSFYRNLQNPGINTEPIPLFRKWVYHLSAQYHYSDLLSFIPRLIYITQGAHEIAQLGTNIRFQKNTAATNAFQIGTWVRGVRNLDGFGAESIVLLFAIEWNSLQLGFSYDANLNDLTNELQGQGVFELSISFIGEYENEVNFCPEF